MVMLVCCILVGALSGCAFAFLWIASAAYQRAERMKRAKGRKAEPKERVVVYMVPVVAEPGQRECDFSGLFSLDDAKHGRIRGFYVGPDGEVVELDHLERRQI